jgi:ribosomal protein S18 acetylase RimI-like enzyme
MSAVPTELSCRSFKRGDQARVQRLILAGLGDHFGEIDPKLNPDLDDITASYVASGHTFVVGEIEGTIVAAGGLIRVQEDLGRLVRVSVAGEYRRKGIGQAIIVYLLKVARQNGYRRLLVETNHDWTDAIALYQRCGFREYDRDEESIHMRLDLTDH